MFSADTKKLLRNVIHHSDTHNRIREEAAMWRQWKKKVEDRYERDHHRYDSDRRESDHRRGPRSTCYMVPRAHMDREQPATSYPGRDEPQRKYYPWVAALQKAEENDPERWGHSGYKELYPDEFRKIYSDSEEEARHYKSKNSKRSHKERRKHKRERRRRHEKHRHSRENGHKDISHTRKSLDREVSSKTAHSDSENSDSSGELSSGEILDDVPNNRHSRTKNAPANKTEKTVTNPLGIHMVGRVSQRSTKHLLRAAEILRRNEVNEDEVQKLLERAGAAQSAAAPKGIPATLATPQNTSKRDKVRGSQNKTTSLTDLATDRTHDRINRWLESCTTSSSPPKSVAEEDVPTQKRKSGQRNDSNLTGDARSGFSDPASKNNAVQEANINGISKELAAGKKHGKKLTDKSDGKTAEGDRKQSEEQQTVVVKTEKIDPEFEKMCENVIKIMAEEEKKTSGRRKEQCEAASKNKARRSNSRESNSRSTSPSSAESSSDSNTSDEQYPRKKKRKAKKRATSSDSEQSSVDEVRHKKKGRKGRSCSKDKEESSEGSSSESEVETRRRRKDRRRSSSESEEEIKRTKKKAKQSKKYDPEDDIRKKRRKKKRHSSSAESEDRRGRRKSRRHSSSESEDGEITKRKRRRRSSSDSSSLDSDSTERDTRGRTRSSSSSASPRNKKKKHGRHSRNAKRTKRKSRQYSSSDSESDSDDDHWKRHKRRKDTPSSYSSSSSEGRHKRRRRRRKYHSSSSD